jgi:hypothetical protein
MAGFEEPYKGKRNTWVVDGDAYELDEFVNRHPGGSGFLFNTKNRDISILVHTYHPNQKKVLRVLEKYRVGPATPDDIVSDLAVPPFLVTPGFDAEQDIPKFDFLSEDSTKYLQPTVIRAIDETKDLKKNLKKLDTLFDFVTYTLMFTHFLTLWALCFEWLPAWACCFIWLITRTGLAGSGHYYLHQRKWNWGESLFDLNFVGASLIAHDGHVLLHHAYTQSEGDVKRTFFGGMMCLPRLWRVPCHTVHRFGNFFSGMMIRGAILCFLEPYFISGKPVQPRTYFWIVRIYMTIECIICIYFGKLVPFAIHFAICMWWNTFLVVASHDFENLHGNYDSTIKDWGVFQIKHAMDLSMTGFPYVDNFLSAGLSCHRVHHVLPFQKTGFSNIYCLPLVKKIAEEQFNVKWEKPRNYWTQRLPQIINHNLVSGKRVLGGVKKYETFLQEHFGFEPLYTALRYMLVGWLGEGAI